MHYFKLNYKISQLFEICHVEQFQFHKINADHTVMMVFFLCFSYFMGKKMFRFKEYNPPSQTFQIVFRKTRENFIINQFCIVLNMSFRLVQTTSVAFIK